MGSSEHGYEIRFCHKDEQFLAYLRQFSALLLRQDSSLLRSDALFAEIGLPNRGRGRCLHHIQEFELQG